MPGGSGGVGGVGGVGGTIGGVGGLGGIGTGGNGTPLQVTPREDIIPLAIACILLSKFKSNNLLSSVLEINPFSISIDGA